MKKALLPAVLAASCLSAPALAEPLPLRKLPLIVGNGLVHVLVEIDGSVKTWGRPGAMAGGPGYGDGTKAMGSPDRLQPAALAGLPPIVDAAIGFGQVLLLTREGTVLAWGNNDGCEVGDGPHTNTIRSPVAVRGLRGIKQVAAGNLFSGAVAADGSVWMWGSGDLGNGERSRNCVGQPTKVEGLAGVKQLSLSDYALALKEDGSVWGWGPNKAGNLCDGTLESRLRPVQAVGVSNAAYVDTGGAAGGQTFIVLADGALLTCGAATSITPKSAVPVRVPGLPPVRTARSDRGTYFVHLVDGRMLGWGNGYHGALGDGHGDREDSKPHEPTKLGPVLAHYSSMTLNYAIRADGMVMGWGQDNPKGPTTFILSPRAQFMVTLPAQ